MLAEFSPVTAAVTVVFGAIAGGVTNAVAIWMLFHPYEPRGFRWLRLQGALPKNKPRLAKTIGRTVGQRLLTSDDLARQLSAPGMREAFDGALLSLVRSVLETERESLRSILPPPMRVEAEAATRSIARMLRERVAEFVRSDAFHDVVRRSIARARREVGDQPIGTVLTAARRGAIRERVEQWVSDGARSTELERTIAAWFDRQFERLSHDKTPLLERLPRDLVAALERAIAGYLPVAIDRLSALLSDRDARARLQAALHELFERFVRDLLLHERIVARLVVTERTFERLLDNFEREGVNDLVLLLEEPAVRDQVARTINDAVVQFLQRPMAEHIERLGAERAQGLKYTAVRHVVDALRDEATLAYATERLDRALQAAEQHTWGDLIEYLPPERAAEWVQRAADSERLAQWVTDGATLALDSLLDRPMGRPADWLGEDASERVAALLSPVLWSWIQGQTPRVVARLDVQTMVEEKVMGFSLERIEQIIRTATQRELDLIVRLGYLLGAIVGAIAYGITMVVG
ncbi:MAG: DUF445 family protein [Gemmatimonadales bacterium]